MDALLSVEEAAKRLGGFDSRIIVRLPTFVRSSRP
jgi:hypothetical protein